VKGCIGENNNTPNHYYLTYYQMKRSLQIRVFIFLCLSASSLYAQTPSDELLMKKYELCVAVAYDHGSWDQYWEGTYLRGNENIGTFTRQTITPMLAAGITDKLNFLLATPYVKTESTGGQMAGVQGFQDLSIALKYEAIKKQLGKGNLAFLVTTAFATPMTNYLSDYMPYSLGLGTNEFTLRGIVHYQLDKGMYVRATGAHLWRGQTEVERDYYYNNGSYYTTYMDVPNAWNYSATLGTWLFDYALRVEASFMALKSTSGDDIRAYNMPQPTNKMEMEQVGAFAQYYFKKSIKGLGVLAYYSQVIDGRNMGKSTNVGVGATYQFQVKNAQ
jgi:hypothetical protein